MELYKRAIYYSIDDGMVDIVLITVFIYGD
jgi:hypothetical protein